MKSFFLSLALLSPVSAQAASFVDVADELSESYKFEQRHNYKDAVAVIAKAQKRQPDSYILNLRLGYLFLSSGITANALEHYTRATEAEPKSVEALLEPCSPVPPGPSHQLPSPQETTASLAQ